MRSHCLVVFAVTLLSSWTLPVCALCPSPAYPPTSSACLNASIYATSPSGTSASDQNLIVAYHNYVRRLQAATDMQLMVWDPEVAYVAQKWSDNCAFTHDANAARAIPGKYSAGQNIAYGYSSWNTTIMAWYNEIYSFTYGSLSYNFGSIGHYTQLVWNSTAKIGCGFTTCTNIGSFYVCNYASAGNLGSQIPFPYTNGTQCAACPNRCNNGLCDCGGIVCKNGGTLNLTTCACSCSSPYTGMPDCNVNCTGVVDAWYCGIFYQPANCTQYYNLPNLCPFMCGVCSAISATTSPSTTALPTATTRPPSATSLPTPTALPPSTTQTFPLTSSQPLMTATNVNGGCPSAAYPANHTACLNTSVYATSPRGISTSDQNLIVAYHNFLRGQQNATDMQRMVWDAEVAYEAQKWSDNCVNKNDDPSQRFIPGKYAVGQSISHGYGNWNNTILSWYNKTLLFTYGNVTYNLADISQYIQLVWNSTVKVGCGVTNCTNLKFRLYVCNYAPAGNIIGQIPTPYTKGVPCAACPGRCTGGLCDCGGLVCYNGGTLNLASCTCTCPSAYPGSPNCSPIGR